MRVKRIVLIRRRKIFGQIQAVALALASIAATGGRSNAIKDGV